MANIIEEIKNLYSFLGVVYMLISTFLLTYVFVIAYINPAKYVIVYIDKLGEADFELILVVICFSSFLCALLEIKRRIIINLK